MMDTHLESFFFFLYLVISSVWHVMIMTIISDNEHVIGRMMYQIVDEKTSPQTLDLRCPPPPQMFDERL